MNKIIPQNIFDWLMINIDNYAIVRMIVEVLEMNFIDMTGFRNMYTLYLLPTEPITKKMLTEELKKIYQRYAGRAIVSDDRLYFIPNTFHITSANNNLR